MAMSRASGRIGPVWSGPTVSRTLFLTAAAMLAFAANSLLCRMALGQGLIDAASFTSVRVLSGAVVLWAIVMLRRDATAPGKADWRAVATLFLYMAFFSFAYLSLDAGTGALVLFGAVQLTMFFVAMREGERMHRLSWGGLALAIAGLVYLVSPGVTAPDPLGAVLMTAAGIAWGIYSLRGRGSTDPIGHTAKNFACAVPFVLLVQVIFLQDFDASTLGFALAVASGALASGCSYVIWYSALPDLTAARAATVQLSVPVIAAFGGVLLLSEPVTLRLLLASAMTLGGVAIVLSQRSARRLRN